MNIGITGSIACGKSTVSNYLKQKGYVIIDADKIGHDILFDDSVKKKLILNFGIEIVSNDEIDRRKLAGVVFGNSERLNLLNSIVHPKIREKILQEYKIHKNEKLIFLDIALLFEADFTDLTDKIIVVHSDKNTQLKRLMNRNSFTKEEALKRINSQISSEEKVRLGDYIIDNNFTLENTYKQIDEILKLLGGKNS